MHVGEDCSERADKLQRRYLTVMELAAGKLNKKLHFLEPVVVNSTTRPLTEVDAHIYKGSKIEDASSRERFCVARKIVV